MTIVRPFEADLLHVLHAILGRAPVDRAAAIVERPGSAPKCLTRGALALIEEALARGSVRKLARGDGWLRERYCQGEGEGVSEGRLWERHSPTDLGLSFTEQSLEFLIRLVAGKLDDLSLHVNALSTGDQFLTFLAYDAFRKTKHGTTFRSRHFIRTHGLCRLAFPADFAKLEKLDEPNLESWFEPDRARVLESLQRALVDSWLDAEREKWIGHDPIVVIQAGREQKRVIDSFFEAADRAGRRDLARFFPRVARAILSNPAELRERLQTAQVKALRLADRAWVGRSALIVLDALDRVRRWEQEARSVGYFDDGYAVAQLLKADWERIGGDELYASGRALLRAIDPLGPSPPT